MSTILRCPICFRPHPCPEHAVPQRYIERTTAALSPEQNDKIRSLGEVRAEKTGDNRLWSVTECLEAALRDVRAGRHPDKVLICFLETGTADEPDFDVQFYAANLQSSHILALISCLQSKVLHHMGYS